MINATEDESLRDMPRTNAGTKLTVQALTPDLWPALKDLFGKWGVSWQITPSVLTEAMAAGGDEAKRAFDAMMGMTKIDIAVIKAARRG